MKNFSRISRRGLMRSTAAAAASLPLISRLAAAEDELVCGGIYVGAKDDYGYNQGQAVAVAKVAEIPNVRVIEEAMVPETVEVQKTMQSMIELDGAKVIFATSYGYYDPHVLEMAAKYPDVHFFHCGGWWEEGQPTNITAYWANVDHGQYINGILAGHQTQTGKLGFVPAVPIPVLLRAINSFTLGAQSVNPDITTQIIWTGDWNVPVKEAEAVNSLADQGCDVVSCDLDSPKVVVETAERRGIYSCGVYADQSALAPNGFLASAIGDWSVLFIESIETMRAGGTLPNSVLGGFANGMVKMSEYGPAVSAEARAAADAAKAGILDGSLEIYTGEIKDNNGNLVVPAGTTYSYDDPFLEQIDWLAEGVIGSPTI
ncbi:MAG: BMP family ABC transporter substrate-binding protein [Rhodospirillaceae bacterium]|nr:BMP family ABC transporter substrate-binding protein [Rhodospirillaceae bacterium]